MMVYFDNECHMLLVIYYFPYVKDLEVVSAAHNDEYCCEKTSSNSYHNNFSLAESSNYTHREVEEERKKRHNLKKCSG